MRLLLCVIIFVCAVGIEATYDAECYLVALKECDYSNKWQQHRCEEGVATIHPTGVALLGIVTKLKEQSYERQTNVPDRTDG